MKKIIRARSRASNPSLIPPVITQRTAVVPDLTSLAALAARDAARRLH